jgi:hypothetical protein
LILCTPLSSEFNLLIPLHCEFILLVAPFPNCFISFIPSSPMLQTIRLILVFFTPEVCSSLRLSPGFQSLSSCPKRECGALSETRQAMVFFQHLSLSTHIRLLPPSTPLPSHTHTKFRTYPPKPPYCVILPHLFGFSLRSAGRISISLF